ncbi:MAG: hypothetical protein ABL962_07435 [Fimbriimonadaceae bacterium]
MTRFRTLAACAVALFAVGAQAQVSKKGDAYLFRLKWKQGAVMKHNMLIDTPMGKMQSVMTQKVLSVDAKGVGTVKGSTTMSGPGMPTGGKPIVTTTKIDPQGNVIGTGATSANFGSMSVPKDPIKIGKQWTGTFKMGQAGGDGSATYKFTRMHSIGGVAVAEISISLKMTGAMPMNGSGSMFVRADNGMTHSMTMTMKGKSPAGGSGAGSPFSMTITMKPG